MGIDPTSVDMSAALHAEEAAEIADRQEALKNSTRLDHEAGRVQLQPGLPVLTADGQQAGSVESTSGGYFKIARRGGEECWLSDVYIESNDGAAVRLVFDASEMDDHALRQPGLQTLDRSLTGTGTREQTEIDALHVREMMEKELIAQRGTMDTGIEDPK